MHFAHGYLGASFFSPLANQRTDEYGGSLGNRLRFHREAMDAVRAVWPERLPLTMRLGSDDFHRDGVVFDDAVWAVGELRRHGLDLADLSLGMNTDDTTDLPFNKAAFMVERGNQVRREVPLPLPLSEGRDAGTCKSRDTRPTGRVAADRSAPSTVHGRPRPALATSPTPLPEREGTGWC